MVERGEMNHFRKIARQRGVWQIIGRYEATPQDAPRKVIAAEYGSPEKDDMWSIEVEAESLPSPSWLAITIE